MKNWLTKERTFKLKTWEIIIDILLSGIIFTMLFYYILVECGEPLINVLKWIHATGIEYKAALVLFPVILIIVAVTKLVLLVSYNNKDSISKTKKKK